MKQFYALLMALVVTLSASALSLNKEANKSINFPKTTKTVKKGVKMVKKDKAPKKADGEITYDDFLGEWDWMAQNLYEDDPEEAIITFPVTISELDRANGTFTVENFVEEGFNLVATMTTVEVEGMEFFALEIPYQVVEPDFFDEGMDLAFTTFDIEIDEEEEMITGIAPNAEKSYILLYDEWDGGFWNFDDGYGYVATVDGQPGETFDFWVVLLYQSYITEGQPGEPEDTVDDDAEYEAYGKAEFIDGWLYPSILFDPADYFQLVHVVDVERNTVEEGVYRLVDPYNRLGEHMIGQESNISTDLGYIKFNIANPKACYVYTNIYSGYKDNNMGKFYFYDLSGYYVCEENYSANEHILSIQIGDDKMSTFDEETGTLNIGAARFGITGRKADRLTWVDDSQNPVEMKAAIKLLEKTDGVSNVNADNDNTIEFFNLQGIRVDNAAKGILIMRNGNEVKKVIR